MATGTSASFSLLPLFALVIATWLWQTHNSMALDNGLARTPPMGWMSWERFTCELDCANYPNDCINERLYMQMADRMAADGYLAAGYKYLSVDDCWDELERDASSQQLKPNASRFSNDMSKLRDHLRERHLFFGLYGDCGTKTCAGYPAQLKSDVDLLDNHFYRDADTLDKWNVRMFKFDGCFIDPLKAEGVCPLFSRALEGEAGNRLPVMLVCEWPFYMMYAHAAPNFTLAAESCNAWRYYDDIEDSWWSISNTIDYTVKHQDTIVKYHGPGHWFDPDQLVIGNFGLSKEQARAQMALWCLWSAPLFMSNDLRAIDKFSSQLLQNPHLIGVNQDPLGVLGLMVRQSEDRQLQAFVKPVEPIVAGCPSFALVYLNRRELGNWVKVSFKLRDLLAKAPVRQAAKNQAEVRHFDRTKRDGRLKLAMSVYSPESTKYLGQPIEASECLARLRKSERNTEYRMFDLIEAKPLGQVKLDELLELRVPPTGVRAVKLVELVAVSNDQAEEADESNGDNSN